MFSDWREHIESSHTGQNTLVHPFFWTSHYLCIRIFSFQADSEMEVKTWWLWLMGRSAIHVYSNRLKNKCLNWEPCNGNIWFKELVLNRNKLNWCVTHFSCIIKQRTSTYLPSYEFRNKNVYSVSFNTRYFVFPLYITLMSFIPYKSASLFSRWL